MVSRERKRIANRIQIRSQMAVSKWTQQRCAMPMQLRNEARMDNVMESRNTIDVPSRQRSRPGQRVDLQMKCPITGRRAVRIYVRVAMRLTRTIGMRIGSRVGEHMEMRAANPLVKEMAMRTAMRVGKQMGNRIGTC